jgi:hypothetical protein
MTPELEAAKKLIERIIPVCYTTGEKALSLLVSAIEERQWVNIRDRLPKTGGNGKSEWVLVYDRQEKRMHTGYYNSHHRCFYDCIGGESFIELTHWMPLPGHPVEIVEGKKDCKFEGTGV